MRSVIVFAGLALAAAAFAPRYAERLDSPPTQPSALETSSGTVDGAAERPRAVVVSPGAGGHFVVEARIQGRPLPFMIDTGASAIALTERDAAELGIHPLRRDFVVEVRTANGTVRAASIRLDTVEVGDLVVRDVAALVLPEGALSDDLLGLSFLSRLRRFEFSDGKLVLEQ